jgi:hypothetical protein
MADQSKATRTEIIFPGMQFCRSKRGEEAKRETSPANRLAAISSSRAKKKYSYEPTFYDIQGA